MRQKDLIENLKQLKAIEPNEEFARVSRSVILSSESGIPVETSKFSVLSRGLSFAASVALTAVFLLVLAIGGTSGSLKTLFLPTLEGVDNGNLTSEATTITNDINIKLNDIEYFEKSERTVALANGNGENLSEGEEEIDQLLDEVIGY